MPKVTFFRQGRVDGGIRTGIEIDGETSFHRFEEGTGDPDPTLVWYVDVICQGRAIPKSPETAYQWLSDQGELLKDATERLSAKLKTGIDGDLWPLKVPLKNAPEGSRITIAVSASGLVGGREIARVIRDVGTHWKTNLKRLSPSTVASE
jgi:hypothetical protein